MSFQRGGRQQCRFFSSGRSCPYGNKCRFPHDPQNPQTLGPTANGRPSRSTSTSHQQEDERPMVPIANTRPTRATGPRGGNRGRGNAADQRNHAKNNPDNPQRKELNAWSYSLRHPGRGYIRDKSAFFVKALDLVNQDAAARQEVVSQLASDEGLQRIAQLQDDSEDWGPSPKEYFFRKRMLPLFQILSHGEVTSSLILEMSTATILNVLFGPSGARAISIFQFAADALSEVAASTDHDTSLKASALRATLAALSLVVDLNSTAIVVKELRKILEEIIKVLDYLAVQEGEHVARVSRPYMKRLKKQFAIGSSIPEPQTGPARVGSRPVFNLEIDGPGVLSPDGPRHDNDHENIEDISILPTESEIRAHRAEYLPTNDGSPHHRTGTKRLADLHFRLLREDTVGPLRDAVRIELGEAENPSTMHGAIRTSQQAAKTYVHSMAFLHHVHSHKSRGLELIYGIPQPPQFKACPPAKRRSLWEVSKRLQVGALLCILTRDGQATFCSVSHNGILEMKRNDKDKAEEDALPQWANLFDSEGTAFVALSVIDPKECTLAPLLENYGAKDSKSSAKLIEFPGVLLAAFESTLRALQTISKSEDLPFSEVLAPTTTHDMVIYPPEYMMEPGFNMQLQCLTTDSTPLTLSPSQRLPAQLLQQHSSLDETQAKAVIDSLSREVALVQGPPGTGKSYTGVAIIRALLANEQKANLAPIVCVCYTNHALDQLLEQLVDSGVNNVVRIGSQSKSEKLKDLNLREISRRIDQTTFERRQRSLAMENVNAATKRLNYELSKYIQASTASSVEQYLKEYQGEHFEELFMKPNVDEEGFQEVTHRQDPVQAWLSKGASKEYLNPRTVDELQETSLALMTQEERRMLHGFWTRDCRDRFSDEIRLALEAYLNARKVLDTCRTEIDLRSLKQALVIGVTTTGLARILKLLKTLGPKILVCEEAGEVLEAHSLATLLPTIQHAIFIGDHLQLKPQIQNFDLSSENPAGKRFSLDRSLFERLIKTAGLPLSTLQTQRRMDPSISDLIRSTLYPNLEDHAVVKSYPEICGLTKRLFWFNHDAPEQQPSEGNMASTSHVNHFEVQMVEAVTSHLLKQGQYGPNEIAILTPYLGQLRALRDALGRSMTIQLEERDQAEMEAQGIEVQTIENSFSQIKQTTLGNAVRIATVDNFQGEEAKFVIVSLVRSNQYRKCRFQGAMNIVAQDTAVTHAPNSAVFLSRE
ncbi:MAG: hypothetical protein M1831_006513 [Alyxoria varia]|nr:MAG: hypothetical protein M1831_006513 [Alyxoria varia]